MAVGVLDYRHDVQLVSAKALNTALHDRHCFVVPVDVIVTILSTVLVHTASQLNDRFLEECIKRKAAAQLVEDCKTGEINGNIEKREHLGSGDSSGLKSTLLHIDDTEVETLISDNVPPRPFSDDRSQNNETLVILRLLCEVSKNASLLAFLIFFYRFFALILYDYLNIPFLSMFGFQCYMSFFFSSSMIIFFHHFRRI